MYIVLFNSEVDGLTTLSNINLAAFTRDPTRIYARCSETSAYKIETPGNYPKENILYSEHGKNLKSRINLQSSRI